MVGFLYTNRDSHSAVADYFTSFLIKNIYHFTHDPQISLKIPTIVMALSMFPKNRISILIVRLSHLSLLLTDGIIPRIAPCLMPIRSTRLYRALAIPPCAPVIMSIVLRPFVMCTLVVRFCRPCSIIGVVTRLRRRGVAGLRAAHCDYI